MAGDTGQPSRKGSIQNRQQRERTEIFVDWCWLKSRFSLMLPQAAPRPPVGRRDTEIAKKGARERSSHWGIQTKQHQW
jgi:hypothetical protein